MNKVHKTISIMPYVVVWYWLFCVLFLLRTEFYTNYFSILNSIDSFIVIFLVIHFLVFRKDYSYKSKIYLQCIYIIILLNFVYTYLNESLYYFLFYFIILMHIIASFWKKQTQIY